MRVAVTIFASSALLFMASSGYAEEPEFGVTAEFMSVCENFSSTDEAANNFLEAGWTEAGVNFRDALSPDDFLKKVRSVRAFSVDLDGGGQWLAATAEGRMGKSKVIYCSVTSIDDDPDGYRQDFEIATKLKSTDSVSHDFEERKIYHVSDKEIYVMREVRASENGFFTYVKLVPTSVKGI